jgi:ABC-type transport system involved in multi-copper enzyme maturation permease subunit
VIVVAVSYAIMAGALVGFSGALVAPGIGAMVRWGLWVELQSVMLFFVALGFSSLVGSRSITVGVLLAWQLILTNILINIQPLPDVRQAVLGVALHQVRPRDLNLDTTFGNNLVMTTTAIAVVLVCWAVVPLALGVWRTATRDA